MPERDRNGPPGPSGPPPRHLTAVVWLILFVAVIVLLGSAVGGAMVKVFTRGG